MTPQQQNLIGYGEERCTKYATSTSKYACPVLVALIGFRMHLPVAGKMQALARCIDGGTNLDVTTGQKMMPIGILPHKKPTYQLLPAPSYL